MKCLDQASDSTVSEQTLSTSCCMQFYNWPYLNSVLKCSRLCDNAVL